MAVQQDLYATRAVWVGSWKVGQFDFVCSMLVGGAAILRARLLFLPLPPAVCDDTSYTLSTL